MSTQDVEKGEQLAHARMLPHTRLRVASVLQTSIFPGRFDAQPDKTIALS